MGMPNTLIGSFVALVLLAPAAAPQGARPPQTTDTRRADLTAFREGFLSRDKSYSDEARREAERRLDALSGRLDTISQPAFELELARIVALADNGHTHYVLGSIQRYYNRVPLRLGTFGGQFSVLRAKTGHRDLLEIGRAHV